MKKLSKLMALLLSLLMILSLFAACGDEKKDDDSKKEDTTESVKLTGEDLLIGKWDTTTTATEDTPFSMKIQLTFESNGAIAGYLSKADYEDMIEQVVEYLLAQYGFENDGSKEFEESKKTAVEAYKEEMPYEDMLAELKDFGTWKLDGDTLTISSESEDGEDNEPMVIETELSKGVDTFEYSEDGSKMTFTKIK